MQSSTYSSWAAFVLAVATLQNVPAAAVQTPQTPETQPQTNSLESRMSRIQARLLAKASQVPNSEASFVGTGWGEGGAEAAGGFGNVRGGGGFGNARGGGGFANNRGGGGFVNTVGGGGFANATPWRNAWTDGGGFVNW